MDQHYNKTRFSRITQIEESHLLLAVCVPDSIDRAKPPGNMAHFLCP